MRKPRSQGLNRLSAEKRETLHRLLSEPMTFQEIARALKTKHGITTSTAALSTYHQRVGRELMIAAQQRGQQLSGGGVEISIRAVSPGEIKLEIRPVQAIDS